MNSAEELIASDIVNKIKKYKNHIPIKMIDDVIFCNQIFLKKSSFFIFLITNTGNIYEVKDKQILHSFSIENEKQLVPDNVKVNIYHSYQKLSKEIFYLINIKTNLFVIKRDDIFGLNLKFSYNNVKLIKIIPGNEYERVSIHFHNNSDSLIITDFSETAKLFDCEKKRNPEMSMNHLKEGLKILKKRTNEARSDFISHQLISQQLFSKHIKNIRMGGIEFTSEFPDERVPLIKYGDIWLKMHNEKIVIGIPIQNCSYGRRFTLTNIRPKIFCEQTEYLSYTFSLFKLKTDSYDFKKFETIFENELKDDYEKDEIPVFEEEWIASKKNILHPEMAGIVVITTSINIKNYNNCKCFIFYDIPMKNNKIQTLQLFAGNINLTSDLYQNKKYLINFNIKEIYRDLLTIVSTSKFVLLKLSYQKEPKENFQIFLLNKMRFIKILSPTSKDETKIMSIESNNTTTWNKKNDEEIMEIDDDNDDHDHRIFYDDINTSKCLLNMIELFYHNEEYWKGTLIRLNNLDSSNILLKIYAKNEHQIISFVRCIYAEYNGYCTILPIKYSIDSIESKNVEFNNSIKNEIELNIEYCQRKKIETIKNDDDRNREFINKRLVKELRTDIARMEIQNST